MLRTITLASAALTLTAPLAAQVSVDRMAPENTVLLLHVKNVNTSIERLKSTGLWNILQSEQVKKMWADAQKQMAEGLDEMFKELGVEEETLVPPTGGLGLAVYPAMNEELGMPELAFMVMADYGENVEKTMTLVQAALERGQEDGDIEVEEKDIAGRAGHVIDLAKLKAKHAEPADDEMDFNPMPMPDADEIFGGVDKLYLVRDGGTLILASHLQGLTDGLDVVDGKSRAAFNERSDVQAIVGKLGDTDITGVLLTRDVMDLFASSEQAGMMGMMKPMIRSVFGKVDGYGMAARLDSDKAMLEYTFSAYMPDGKAGLTSLVDSPVARKPLPPFVSAEAISYSTFNFEFGGLMDVIRTIVNTNPMLQMQLGQALPEIEPVVKQITSALGTQIHMASSAKKPFTAANQQTSFAIECEKPQEFENAFAQFAPQMGMESRDFLGQRIYSMDPAMAGMMMPPGMGGEDPLSVGIGGGFVFIGATPSVEQSLRATSQPGAGGLAETAPYKRATALVQGDNIIAWGYSDTITTAEAAFAVQKEAFQKEVNEMKEWDPEMAAEIEKEAGQYIRMFENIDWPLLRRHIGPGAWQVEATADGFIMRSYQLGVDAN